MLNCVKCEKEFKPTHHTNKKYCSKKCMLSACSKSWRINNPGKDAAHKRKNSLKRKYGLSEETYDYLLKKQNEKCAICMKTTQRKLDVDHCHETGQIRGLLCNPCNQAIGLLKHDPLIIKSALEYVS